MNIENYVTPWTNISAKKFDTWHSMCSYLGAFPAPLAYYFIRHFSEEEDIVYDPFSGRGTTLLEARNLNRYAIASDLNPIALALSEAKNQVLEKEEIFIRVDELSGKFDSVLFMPEAMAQQDEIHLIYHPRTLAQLCYLKRKLLKSSLPVDKFIIGCILGIMHGGERKDGTSGYASISMPNTFSMSPEYVRRFVQTNQLNREYRDVFALIKEKANRLYEKHKTLHPHGTVVKADAKFLSTAEPLKQFQGKVKLVLTSPPYLGIVNYAKQNWIRSWFLDQDPLTVSKDLDDDLNLNEWIIFSRQFVRELKTFMRPDGVAIFVIGDVAKSKTSVVPLAREFALMVKENKFFKNVWCINDTIADTDKTTRIWGDSKGVATTTDRIIILSDINPFKNTKTIEGFEPLDFTFIEESTKSIIGI